MRMIEDWKRSHTVAVMWLGLVVMVMIVAWSTHGGGKAVIFSEAVTKTIVFTVIDETGLVVSSTTVLIDTDPFTIDQRHTVYITGVYKEGVKLPTDFNESEKGLKRHNDAVEKRMSFLTEEEWDMALARRVLALEERMDKHEAGSMYIVREIHPPEPVDFIVEPDSTTARWVITD